MQDKRGWWYLLSIFSLPLLFLARAGRFGHEAQEQSELALGDWAAYGRVLLRVLALVLVVVALVMLYEAVV